MENNTNLHQKTILQVRFRQARNLRLPFHFVCLFVFVFVFQPMESLPMLISGSGDIVLIKLQLLFSIAKLSKIYEIL